MLISQPMLSEWHQRGESVKLAPCWGGNAEMQSGVELQAARECDFNEPAPPPKLREKISWGVNPQQLH